MEPGLCMEFTYADLKFLGIMHLIYAQMNIRNVLSLFSCVLLIVSDTQVINAQKSVDRYELVFSDEFDLPDGSQPDSTKWKRAKRYSNTWNRWISDNKNVVFIKNGNLICKAVPNKYEKSDTASMLTGAIETRDTYSFIYGKVEVKMRTNRHKGNFPAVWMRNYDYKKPSLPYGEIDIVEVFGNRMESSHTAHTKLTINDAKYRFVNHGRNSLNPEEWHIYGIEWTPNYISWYVDGKIVHTYAKSLDKALLDKGQWTFDTPFFLILNQSVGNGEHGMMPDMDYTYETLFDWIRVYQLDGEH